MKTIAITTTSELDRCTQLKRSLILNEWPFHFIVHDWHPQGFLGKIHETYKYLKGVTDYTHFIYTDAWDTVAMKGPDAVAIPDGFMISAERACYPHGDKEPLYPKHPSPWHFVNGGGWCGEIATFLKYYELHPPTTELNDQVWLTDLFLKFQKEPDITLDYECRIFQTLAFCPESDFSYPDGKVFNTVNQTYPAFIHGNGHTPMPHIYKLFPDTMNTLNEAASQWANNRETHKRINETFTANVNATPELKAYRDWIESKIFGFGERSFLWMWKLIVDTLPPDFSFLEIGVFRGQILGLIRMLAPKATITGITPLDSSDGHWESDYAADIKLLHDTFKLKQPKIIKGLSTAPEVMEKASAKMYDIIYVDGGHTYEVAKHDVFKYSSFVKVGGYLVIDDCSHKYDLPDGYFRGIEPVSRAVDELLPNDYYKEVMNVMHNRIFRRVR